MFSLRWLDSVTRDLLQATAIADQSIRDRVLSAMAEVEAKLENDADVVGESREPGTRFLIVPPLSITYQINARKREVLIVEARVHRIKS
jgi:hypothetical protein